MVVLVLDSVVMSWYDYSVTAFSAGNLLARTVLTVAVMVAVYSKYLTRTSFWNTVTHSTSWSSKQEVISWQEAKLIPSALVPPKRHVDWSKSKERERDSVGGGGGGRFSTWRHGAVPTLPKTGTQLVKRLQNAPCNSCYSVRIKDDRHNYTRNAKSLYPREHIEYNRAGTCLAVQNGLLIILATVPIIRAFPVIIFVVPNSGTPPYFNAH